MLNFYLAGNELWKGPTHPEENLHFSRFEGFMDAAHGFQLIWVLRRTAAGNDWTPISHQEAREMIVDDLLHYLQPGR